MATKKIFTPDLTAVVIARNEEEMLANCLETLHFATEVVVLDTGSTDRTIEIAKQQGAKVFQAQGTNFSSWREEAATYVKTKWLLYIDADERVTPALAKTIIGRISRDDYDAYTLARNNIHFGKWLQHGGWQHDQLLRLFKTDKLVGWSGRVHESAQIKGRIGEIEEPLVHLTHRSIAAGLRKSADWTNIEADLLFEAKHKKVGPLRLIKIVIFDFFKRVFIKMAWKDGQEGLLEALIQSMNRFLVYAQLWEKQQQPSLPKRYDRIEQQIQKLWQQPNDDLEKN